MIVEYKLTKNNRNEYTIPYFIEDGGQMFDGTTMLGRVDDNVDVPANISSQTMYEVFNRLKGLSPTDPETGVALTTSQMWDQVSSLFSKDIEKYAADNTLSMEEAILFFTSEQATIQTTTVFKQYTNRPIVEVTLSDGVTIITVDGGRDDLDNFQIGKDLQTPFIVDSNNNTITIDPTLDYDLILTAIKNKGLQYMQAKWDAKAAVNAIDLTSLTAVGDLQNLDIDAFFSVV